MNSQSPQKRTAFDPPISVTDDDRHVRVSVDLPGVTEEQIRIDLEKRSCTLSVSKDEKLFHKTIRVPEGVRFYKKKFSDGVLDIYLEKTAP
jgi:HSP20 family molecular chaperone IbpA